MEEISGDIIDHFLLFETFLNLAQLHNKHRISAGFAGEQSPATRDILRPKSIRQLIRRVAVVSPNSVLGDVEAKF